MRFIEPIEVALVFSDYEKSKIHMSLCRELRDQIEFARDAFHAAG